MLILSIFGGDRAPIRADAVRGRRTSSRKNPHRTPSLHAQVTLASDCRRDDRPIGLERLSVVASGIDLLGE
jgi:hypothetical protein